MINFEALRFSRNMKYTALYSSMFFAEDDENIYKKIYEDGTIILIEADTQKLFINNKFSFLLNSHESFVKLECIDRILNLGYTINDIEHISNEDFFFFKGFKIIFFAWNNQYDFQKLTDNVILYKSRLVSGVIEYKSKIRTDDVYDYGVFEKKVNHFIFRKVKETKYNDKDFFIEENKLIRYLGKNKLVIVPYGIEEIESSAFWDNQYIEKVVLPDSLINYGGDTFYNCKNLKEVNIPKSVKFMGDNPFAGCLDVTVTNQSENFIFENGALYTADRKNLIYISIRGKEDYFEIPEGTILIGKHAFFMCNRFTKITIPKTVIKMKNNPFSGCSQLDLDNRSPYYHVIDSVIYNKFKTAVVGCLNNIKINELRLLETTKSINRNSFWNCLGIKKIVFPESLVDIGYNPFVGCSNIHFESLSKRYRVVDDVLYNEDCSVLICYPSWKAVGDVHIPDSVITLERGAFSGCTELKNINLHNVNIINKSCFTNCSSLEKIYCSDFIRYIGEWAFAYCKNLEEVSVYNETKIDNNAFSNCSPKIIRRPNLSNYLVESDNIYTLRSLKAIYTKSIDSILIDPPYNSNIDYIGYKDSNYENGYYNFLMDRISIAREILSNKGFLVINIDEGELETIKTICQSLFDKNLISVHRWKKKHPFFDKNRVVLNPNKKQTDYEYIVICRASENAKFNKIHQPYIENDDILENITNVPETFDCFGTTSSAKDEINEIFGRRDYFSTPKPLKLMMELVRATTNKESIVLDFFAGSGTVGHAVNELNKEDNGKRTFILVSNNESDICKKVTSKRLELIKSNFTFLD